MRLLDPHHEHDRHIAERLAVEPVIWLATRGREFPHVVPVWFLWDDPVVLIFSAPQTRKLADMAHQPAVTLTLDSADDGQDIVIMNGRAEIVAGNEIDATAPAFADKYVDRRSGSAADWATTFSQPVRVSVCRILSWVKDVPGGPPRVRDLRGEL